MDRVGDALQVECSLYAFACGRGRDTSLSRCQSSPSTGRSRHIRGSLVGAEWHQTGPTTNHVRGAKRPAKSDAKQSEYTCLLAACDLGENRIHARRLRREEGGNLAGARVFTVGGWLGVGAVQGQDQIGLRSRPYPYAERLTGPGAYRRPPRGWTILAQST